MSPYEKEPARRIWRPFFRTKHQTQERRIKIVRYFLNTRNTGHRVQNFVLKIVAQRSEAPQMEVMKPSLTTT